MPVSYLSIKRAHDLAEFYHAKPRLLPGEKTDNDGRHLDKNGDLYIFHLEAVSEGSKVLGADSEIRAAALLHDAVEDTAMTYTMLRDFGASERQIKAIEAVTKRSSEAQTAYLDRIIAGGQDSIRIKLADLLHNLRGDRLAKLPEATRDRLRRKYSPSMARLFNELGYILTTEQYAAIPASSTYSYTGAGSSGIYEWKKRKASWYSANDQVKLGKGKDERILIVASKVEDYVNKMVKLIFTTGEFVQVASDKEILVGRMKPYESSGSSGKAVGSTTTPTAGTPTTVPTFSAPSRSAAAQGYQAKHSSPTHPAVIPFGNTNAYRPEDEDDPWAAGLHGYDGLAVYGE